MAAVGQPNSRSWLGALAVLVKQVAIHKEDMSMPVSPSAHVR